ncbi:MAG: metabolite traffic protein EboE [Williamsia sp.]|nr:metabolite traffic protein EboE [Williamsia sp.]
MQYGHQHITFCTNVYPGESWDEHFAELKLHFPGIKQAVSPTQAMGIGLRLSNQASLDLTEGDKLAEFKQWLRGNDAYVFTMNGFPYGAFHHHAVKAAVHAPDWTTKDRLDYTLRLFDILQQLLPEGMDGGISTSPLSYRHWFNTEAEKAEAFTKATHHISLVAEKLVHIRNTTGKILHLDIEPEPDGLLETGTEFINWYEDQLVKTGTKCLAGKGHVSASEAEALLKEHICLCYDVCHFAIGYEDHAAVIARLAEKGIRTGKIQVSAALQAQLTGDSKQREQVGSALAGFNESVYLHQVIAHKRDGEIIRFRDLPDALPNLLDTTVDEWRVHFHIPVFTPRLDPVQSTQQSICTVLDLQKGAPFTNHLEVETYTWEVLPAALKLPIVQSISRELDWLLQYMKS